MSREIEQRYEEILNRLKIYASAQHGSVRQMSLAIGRSPTYFNSYFQKKSLPSLLILSELQPHRLDLYWLFSGDYFSSGLRTEDMDFETQRAYILQERYSRQSASNDLVAEAGQSYSTKGESMDQRTLSEIWDQISTQFPGTPLWDQMDETNRRDAMYDVYETLLRVQRGIKVNREEVE
jgi:hypothetical protein